MQRLFPSGNQGYIRNLGRFLSWFRPEHFFTGASVIMDYGLIFLDWFMFQLLSSPDVNWWTGVVWITCGLLWFFFRLSFWRHPFIAQHPLLRRCRDTFLHIWWRNKIKYISDGLRGEYIFCRFSVLGKLFPLGLPTLHLTRIKSCSLCISNIRHGQGYINYL